MLREREQEWIRTESPFIRASIENQNESENFPVEAMAFLNEPFCLVDFIQPFRAFPTNSKPKYDPKPETLSLRSAESTLGLLVKCIRVRR